MEILKIGIFLSALLLIILAYDLGRMNGIESERERSYKDGYGSGCETGYGTGYAEGYRKASDIIEPKIDILEKEYALQIKKLRKENSILQDILGKSSISGEGLGDS